MNGVKIRQGDNGVEEVEAWTDKGTGIKRMRSKEIRERKEGGERRPRRQKRDGTEVREGRSSKRIEQCMTKNRQKREGKEERSRKKCEAREKENEKKNMRAIG